MMMNTALFNIIAAATVNLMGGTTDVVSKIMGGAKVGVLTEESEVLGTAMWMALFCGVVFCILVLCFGEQALQATGSMDWNVYVVAVEYMRVRAFALPATMLNFVIIGFSLGVQEMVAPFLLIATSLLVNVAGDIYLVPLQGLRGAAIATAIAGYAGTFVGMARLLTKYRVNLLTLGSQKFSLDGDTTFRKPSGLAALGAWFGRLKVQVAPFWGTSSTLFCGKLTDALTYSAGAYVTTYCDPTIRTQVSAAHQIVLQTWWFLSFFPMALAMTSQSYLPKDLASGRLQHGRDLIMMNIRLGAILAMAAAGVQWLLPSVFPNLFTEVEDIQQLVLTVVPQACLSQLLVDCATPMDGVFVGSGRLRHYILTCVLSTGATWLWFYHCIQTNGGLEGYWNGLVIFGVVRLSCHAYKLPEVLQEMYCAGGASGEAGAGAMGEFGKTKERKGSNPALDTY
jgi:Na+-driven multidrug efflux pump